MMQGNTGVKYGKTTKKTDMNLLQTMKSMKGALIGTSIGLGARIHLNDKLPEFYENLGNVMPTRLEDEFSKLAEYATIAQKSFSEISNPDTYYLISQLCASTPIIATGFLLGLTYNILFNKENK